LGISLGLVMFTWLYIIGPGLRGPITLYITSVSFPYNINMLATLLIPLLFARAFDYPPSYGDRKSISYEA
jgi:hypothetical protein